jgi:hypothetical protein
MKPAEIQPLIMAAREAFAVQDPGCTFDEWRSEQVMESVNLPGLTACDSKHFCQLMGHFKMAAGLEDEALHWFLRDGKNDERQTAFSIVKTLTEHMALAHTTPTEIEASTPPRQLKRRLACHEAIKDHPEGPLSFDYLVAIVRDKTRRPDLTLGSDLKTSLAERCTLQQLVQIRYTLVNRIAEREGRGNTADRNRSQNSDAAKARRSPESVVQRF